MDFDSLQEDKPQAAAAQSPAQPAKFDELPEDKSEFDSMPDDAEKYGTPGQQAITALEGAAEGVAGPLAPYAEEKLGLATPEEMKGRHETNPGIHAAGEAAGFAGSMLTGVGEAALVGKAGELALKATQLANLGKDASTAAKLARGAVRLTTEMGLLGASNEASRAIENGAESPGDVISQMKMSNILGSAAIGAAGGPIFEGAGSLLKRTMDLPFLQQFTDRLALLRSMEGEIPEGFKGFGKPQGMAEKMADAWNEKWTPKLIGDAIAAEMGEKFGGNLGAAYVSKQVLGPVFSTILKPIMEKYPNLDLNAVKAATAFAQKTLEGDALLSKGVKAVISGGETLPSNFMPTQAELEDLDKHAESLNGKMEQQSAPGTEIGGYMPVHATTLSKSVNAAVNYINNARPQPTHTGVMNEPIPPSKADMYKYYQKLQVVQQPLSVLQKIKDGTLLPTDVAIMTTIYPEYHSKIVRQLMQEITENQQQGKLVPYRTKQALSLFMGQNMVNSLQPQSIMAAQPMPRMPANQPAGTGKAKNKQSLNKGPGMYQTPTQNAESDRSQRD